jgi:hypothetical protein
MIEKDVADGGAGVFLTADELLILSNALNEVCNGLDIPEFATRIGAEREDALRLLKSIGNLYDQVVDHPAGTTSKS